MIAAVDETADLPSDPLRCAGEQANPLRPPRGIASSVPYPIHAGRFGQQGDPSGFHRLPLGFAPVCQQETAKNPR
jgi:hypothetical protein